MKRQILFIHSAGPQGYHEGSNFLVNYLKKTLDPSYELYYPLMPDPENPHYEAWKAKLERELASLTGETLLIGHSLGGSVLLKYLSESTFNKSIAGLFVIAAPYWGASDWEVDEYVLNKNFSTQLPPIHHLFLYHSNNDEVVPDTHMQYYAQELPDATLRLCGNRGHLFSKGLPELVYDIKSIR